MASEWIDASERLPEPDTTVLVCVVYSVAPHTPCVTVDGIAGSTGQWAEHFRERVTHWMPMPDAPAR